MFKSRNSYVFYIHGNFQHNFIKIYYFHGYLVFLKLASHIPTSVFIEAETRKKLFLKFPNLVKFMMFNAKFSIFHESSSSFSMPSNALG